MADSTATDERTCTTCGVSITHLFKLRKYCDQHTPRRNTKGMKPCPKCGKKSWASKTQCRACAAATVHKTRCQTCERRGRSRCSTCYWNAKEAEECGACGQHRKLIAKGMCPSCYATAYRTEHGRKKYYRDFECEHCGITATSAKKSTRFCSLECAQRNAAGWVHSTDLVRSTSGPKASAADVARARIKIAARGTSGRYVWVQGSCIVCSAPFTCRGLSARYCSKRCRARNRQKKHGLSFLDRVALFDRDGWRCQICSEPVNWSAHHQSDWYPTIDHIVPQALGGTHELSNLRTAHRWCNSVRGDTTRYTDADLRG